MEKKLKREGENLEREEERKEGGKSLQIELSMGWDFPIEEKFWEGRLVEEGELEELEMEEWEEWKEGEGEGEEWGEGPLFKKGGWHYLEI
jgi:hypothetical protein